MNGGIVTDSFWDTTTSLQGLSAGGAGVKGMPTLDMMQQLNFTTATGANAPLSPTWDFTNLWTMVTNGATYPSLQVCLVPATWTAVPVPPEPPVLPIETTPITTADIAPEEMMGEQMALTTTPAWWPTVVSTGTPDQLLAFAPPATPPVLLATEEPIIVPTETPPKIYVAPYFRHKQDRN